MASMYSSAAKVSSGLPAVTKPITMPSLITRPVPERHTLLNGTFLGSSALIASALIISYAIFSMKLKKRKSKAARKPASTPKPNANPYSSTDTSATSTLCNVNIPNPPAKVLQRPKRHPKGVIRFARNTQRYSIQADTRARSHQATAPMRRSARQKPIRSVSNESLRELSEVHDAWLRRDAEERALGKFQTDWLELKAGLRKEKEEEDFVKEDDGLGIAAALALGVGVPKAYFSTPDLPSAFPGLSA